jgi:hypothetical protein
MATGALADLQDGIAQVEPIRCVATAVAQALES